MSQTSVSATQATKEANHEDQQKDGDRESTPSQADAGEHAEATVQDSQSQVGEHPTQQPPDMRRSERSRTLTEKGKAQLDERLCDLKAHFLKLYGKWKFQINGLRHSIKKNDDVDLIEDVVSTINSIQDQIDKTYLKIRDIATPEPEIRRINDTCNALTVTANKRAQQYLSGNEDSEVVPWPEAESVFDSTVSSASSLKPSCKSTTSSSQSRYKKQQAAAEVAATQEVLKIMKEQHQREEEIRKLEVQEQMLTAQREAEEKEIEAESARKQTQFILLTAQREAEEKEIEAENARKQTQFISESAARRTELERKKREVERLEEIKKHNAAQARLNIFSEDQYDEVEHQSAIFTEQGQDIYPSPLKVPISLHQSSALNPVSNPLYPAQQAPPPQARVPVSLHQSSALNPVSNPLYPAQQAPPPQARVPVSLHQSSALNPVSNPLYPAQQAPPPQASPAQSNPPYHPHLAAVTNTSPPHPSTFTSNYTPQPASFLQSPMVHQAILTQPPTVQQVPLTKAPTTHSPTFTTSHEASNDLVRTLAEAITANRIPIPEPAVFIGDPLKYNDWKLSFCTLIDRKNLPTQEKLFFLRKYVGGPAKRAIEGHFLVATETAYKAAWDKLEDRYGNPFVIGKAYRDKIHAWHKIGQKDSEDLREFVDFLSSVESAMPYVQGLQALNDCVENQKMAAKLPDWLSARWNRKVTMYQDEHKLFPDFSCFMQLLNLEARIACNPVTSFSAIKLTEQEAKQNQKPSARVFTTSSSEQTSSMCIFCKRQGHTHHKCFKMMERSVEERITFVRLERLCFGCLKTGHNSKACTSRSICDSCGRNHPTCLHQDRWKYNQEQRRETKQTEDEQSNETKDAKDKEFTLTHALESKQATSNRVVQEENNTHTSTVVPVYVSTSAEPDKEVLVYALLDSQSDTTFILKDTAEALDVKKESVKLTVSTITSSTKVVSSQRMNGLQVRGINSESVIKLPTTYTTDFIPANRSNIPTSKTAKVWPHLEHLEHEMFPELDCEVGLLIGYNCPQALLPRDVISGSEDQPFALKSALGWSIVGYSNAAVDGHDETGLSQSIITKQVMPDIMSPIEQSKRHCVVAKDNLADSASRRLTAKELVESNRFTGQSFLCQRELPKEENIKVGELDDEDPELKAAQVHATKAKKKRKNRVKVKAKTMKEDKKKEKGSGSDPQSKEYAESGADQKGRKTILSSDETVVVEDTSWKPSQKKPRMYSSGSLSSGAENADEYKRRKKKPGKQRGRCSCCKRRNGKVNVSPVTVLPRPEISGRWQRLPKSSQELMGKSGSSNYCLVTQHETVKAHTQLDHFIWKDPYIKRSFCLKLNKRSIQ